MDNIEIKVVSCINIIYQKFIDISLLILYTYKQDLSLYTAYEFYTYFTNILVRFSRNK